MKGDLAVTRVVNSCVLIEFDEGSVLTDPYFENPWWYRFAEPIGLRVDQLPRLDAILGGHGLFDHWRPQSLASYPFKETTPVYVSTGAMARQARAAGFKDVEQLDWEEVRILPNGLIIEAPPAQIVTGSKTNNYIIESPDWRVFVGTEARDLEPLRRYRRSHEPIDLVFAPVDGARLLGQKLVMNPEDAIEAAHILGAGMLVPFHYAMKPRGPLLQTPYSLSDVMQLQDSAPDVEIIALSPGERRTLRSTRRRHEPLGPALSRG